MISEGSCDTEDCSNDVENSAKYSKIEYSYFKMQNYFTILQFLLYFLSNKCSLGDHIGDFFKKIKK